MTTPTEQHVERQTCPEHGRPQHVGTCIGCAADHKAGDHTGRPRPACPVCAPAYRPEVPA